MKIKWFSIGTAFFAGQLFLAGCYPSESLLTEEFDTVVTVYDSEQDFTKFKTYTMPDTVVQIGDPDSNDYIDLEITQDEMDKIVNQVRQNMNALGYVEIKPNPDTGVLDQEPDVGLFVEALGQKRTVIYTYPGGGWGGYWGWYSGFPGWGWGPGWGGWYPPAVGSYSYPVGTLIVNYVDVGEDEPGNGSDGPFIPTPWIGILNGILQQTTAGDSRVTSSIDQMFDQSPYLKPN